MVGNAKLMVISFSPLLPKCDLCVKFIYTFFFFLLFFFLQFLYRGVFTINEVQQQITGLWRLTTHDTLKGMMCHLVKFSVISGFMCGTQLKITYFCNLVDGSIPMNF